MKEDEKKFLLTVYYSKLKPREIINFPSFFMHHKRAWRILEKWSDKGWYDYGVTLDLGWLTEEGIKKAMELRG